MHKRNSIYSRRIQRLSFVGFAFAFAFASFNTVWAIYLDSFLHSEVLVGIVSSVFTVLSVILYFLFIPFLEKYPKKKIYTYSVIGIFLSYVFFYFNADFYLLLAIALLLVSSKVMHSSSFGIVFRDQIKLKNIGRSEGLRFTFDNFGWLIAPLIAGIILSEYGIAPIFLVAAIFIFISLIVFKSANVKSHASSRKIDSNIFQNVKDFFKNKDLRLIHAVSGGMSWWWGVIYIYVPLFILKEGLDLVWVGIFLFAIVLPLLIEYFVGRVEDRIGFRIFLVSGFLILSLFGLLAFFASNVFIILGILVLASFGASFIESTREAYFFKLVPVSKEEKFYGPYLTYGDIWGTIGNLVTVAILVFLPFKFIFLGLAVSMLFFAYLSSRLRN